VVPVPVPEEEVEIVVAVAPILEEVVESVVEPEPVSLAEASTAMASATSAVEVMDIVQSTMASGADTIAEPGTVVAEVKTISVSPTGAPPVFDSTSWLKDNGIAVDVDSKVNSQVFSAKIEKQFTIPKKTNVAKDGKV